MSTEPAVDVQFIEHQGYRHAIHLCDTSEGTGDLVLLHGAGVASEATWYPMLSEFKSFRRITCPDLRGMGRSHSLDFADRSVTVDEVVENVIAILAHYSISQCQMVGYSFGGLIAPLVNAARRELFCDMVLLQPALLERASFDALRPLSCQKAIHRSA